MVLSYSFMIRTTLKYYDYIDFFTYNFGYSSQILSVNILQPRSYYLHNSFGRYVKSPLFRKFVSIAVY